MRVLSSLVALCVSISAGLAAGCAPEASATRVIASVDSNLDPGTHLDEVRVETFDRTGETRGGLRIFALSSDVPAPAGKYRFPFSFRVDRKTQDELLLAVSGWKDGEKRVEQRLLVRFADGETRYLQTFLGGVCLSADCSETQTCYPFSRSGLPAGTCGDPPDAELVSVDPRGTDGTWGVDAGSFDAGAFDAGPDASDEGGSVSAEAGMAAVDDCDGGADTGTCEDTSARECRDGEHACDTELGVECTTSQSGPVCGACPEGFVEDKNAESQRCVPTLEALAVDGRSLTPPLDGAETDYQVSVGPWKDQVAVVPSARDGHEVRVNGELVTSGEQLTQAVALGRTDLEVLVSALGRSRSYAVQVERKEAKAVYLKSAAPAEGDNLGAYVAVSSDGKTMAVGAPNEDQGGAVYVFSKGESDWSDPVRLQPPNAGAGDGFGAALAISADGAVLAVGAPYADACWDGQAQGDACPENSGAVSVYVKTDKAWSAAVRLGRARTTARSEFGTSVALSADGHKLLVGAPGSEDLSGLVHSFALVDGTWVEEELLAFRLVGALGDGFGRRVSLNATGDMVAIAASPRADTGRVYLSSYRSGAWTAPVLLPTSQEVDETFAFGSGLALSGDGKTLVVGDPSAQRSYVFVQRANGWQHQAVLGPKNTGMLTFFGATVSLSNDGSTLVVGAYGDAGFAGTGHVYTRSGEGWTEPHRLLASNQPVGEQANFGLSVALSGDGEILAVGAPSDDWCEGGIAADRSTNRCPAAGALYVFE